MHLIKVGLWSLIQIILILGLNTTIPLDHDTYKVTSMTFQILVFFFSVNFTRY